MPKHALISALIFVTLLMVLIGWIGVEFAEYRCDRLGNQINKQTEYQFPGAGCTIEVNGQMVPEENWREFTNN